MLITSQLGLNGLSMSTIKSYLVSICNLLINNSFQDVNIYSPQVELVIQGIKCLKRMSATQKVWLTITPLLLWLPTMRAVHHLHGPGFRPFQAPNLQGYVGKSWWPVITDDNQIENIKNRSIWQRLYIQRTGATLWGHGGLCQAARVKRRLIVSH